jgi:hypothetical protein
VIIILILLRIAILSRAQFADGNPVNTVCCWHWCRQCTYDISKPGYYYDTIMTFGINYVHYDTIMTLLLHLWQFYYCHYDISNILWHLWLLLHYYIHSCISIYYNTYNIEVLLFAIMTNAKHYVHYGYYINCHKMNNSHNSNNIFLLISTHKRGIWG